MCPDITAAQKLGLQPLLLCQKEGKVQDKIDKLVENNNLPRWAYLKTEFESYRRKLQLLLIEKSKLRK